MHVGEVLLTTFRPESAAIAQRAFRVTLTDRASCARAVDVAEATQYLQESQETKQVKLSPRASGTGADS